MATPRAAKSSSTAEDRKAIRRTAIVRFLRFSASVRRRPAVRSTASSARIVSRPRRRSSRKAFMLPVSASCFSLAAFACQPISAMKSGIVGMESNRTSAAIQVNGRIASTKTKGTMVAFIRAGWNLER
ncbi:hypothetical protein D3C87_1424500 [compost metagenome]